jgi:hypothetical protein
MKYPQIQRDRKKDKSVERDPAEGRPHGGGAQWR